jgi:hypothetical protein
MISLTTKRLASGMVAALLLGASGCASLRLGDERRAYYLKEVGSYAYAKGCLDVWPSVLKVLGSKGYPLKGRDRQYGGEGPQSGFSSVVEQADETKAVEGGGLMVRTGWLPGASNNTRYEVTGNPAVPSGCSVTFTLITTGTVDVSSESREIDWRIQMELLKAVQPDAAARIDAGAPKGG